MDHQESSKKYSKQLYVASFVEEWLESNSTFAAYKFLASSAVTIN